MSLLCRCCWSPDHEAINQALIEHDVGYRLLAARFGVSYSGLRRHEAHHLAHALAETQEARVMMDAEALTAKLLELDEAVRLVLARGEQASDDRLVLLAVKEGRGDVETLARLGALGDVEARLARLEAAQQGDEDHDVDAGRR